MGWFSRTKTTAPEQQVVSIAPGKLNLNFHRHSAEALSTMADATLASGGFEESKPKDPKIGDNAVPCIGHRMPDGTVYAGVSPDTGKPMYVTPADAPLTMTFNDAVSYAKKLDVHGHQDWRLPSTEELNVLFNNRAAIGGFNVSGSYPAGWYWSASSDGKWYAWDQRFSDGYQISNGEDYHSSVRCVRQAAARR